MTSIFGGAFTVNVSASGTLVPEKFAPVDGQTVFTLTTFTYTPNTNSLLVFINGQKQSFGADFIETSSSTFTLTSPITSSDIVDVIGFPLADISQVANYSDPRGSSRIGYTPAVTGAAIAAVEGKLRETVSVLDFAGVVANGIVDDGQAVSTAIANLAPYTEIVVPTGVTLAVSRIVIDNKSNFIFRVDGKIKNIGTKPGAAGVDANTSARGLSATFYITNSSRFIIYGPGQIDPGYREAFCIGEYLPANVAAPCSDFAISIDIVGQGLNDNIHVNRIRYCSRFYLKDMSIASAGKKPAWVNAATAYYYDWVENILLWDCVDFNISGVTSRNSSMNGIYVGSNCERFSIQSNDLQHNCGSAVQLAWSSFGNFPRGFIISNNRTSFNRADGVDINNTGSLIDVYGAVVDNIHYYNGWGTEDTAGTSPTNDGSGIGTFKKMKKLLVGGNISIEPARTGVFLENIWDSKVSNNIVHKTAAATLGEGVYCETCTNVDVRENIVSVPATLPAYKLYSAIGNTNVKAIGNNFEGLIQFAGGTYVDCSFDENKVITTTQVTIPVNASDNTIIVSGAGQNGVYVGANNIVLEKNRVTAPNYAIVSANATDITLAYNTATGQNGGIYIDANKHSRFTGNTGSGQGSPGIHLNGACDNCELSMNRASSVTGNSFRVESTCTNTHKWGNRIISGTASFAGTYGINY